MVSYAQTERGRAQAANGRRRKRRRRGRLRGHFTLLILFLLAAAAVLCMTVFFKVQDIRVIGTDKYDPDRVAAASGIQMEDNLLRVDAAEVEKRILEQFPYINTVEVKYKLPPAVEITVTQCEVAGAIHQDGDIVLISREGKVLERGSLLVPENVPIVKGINVFNIRPGGTLPESQAEKLGMLRRLLDAMDETGFTNITNVDITDRLNMKTLYENRIVLQLGSEAELAHKLEFIKFTLENKLTPDDKGTLDATEAHLARQVIFKPNVGMGEALGDGASPVAEEGEGQPVPEEERSMEEMEDESAENPSDMTG